MPLDRHDLEELQNTAEELNKRAASGDDVAFRVYCETASWLKANGLSAPERSAPADGLIDPRVECLDSRQTRFGFVR